MRVLPQVKRVSEAVRCAKHTAARLRARSRPCQPSYPQAELGSDVFNLLPWPSPNATSCVAFTAPKAADKPNFNPSQN